MPERAVRKKWKPTYSEVSSSFECNISGVLEGLFICLFVEDIFCIPNRAEAWLLFCAAGSAGGLGMCPIPHALLLYAQPVLHTDWLSWHAESLIISMGFKSSSGCYTNRWTSSLQPLQVGTLEFSHLWSRFFEGKCWECIKLTQQAENT